MTRHNSSGCPFLLPTFPCRAPAARPSSPPRTPQPRARGCQVGLLSKPHVGPQPAWLSSSLEVPCHPCSPDARHPGGLPTLQSKQSRRTGGRCSFSGAPRSISNIARNNITGSSLQETCGRTFPTDDMKSPTATTFTDTETIFSRKEETSSSTFQ